MWLFGRAVDRLSVDKMGEVLDVSIDTLKRDWRAKLTLVRELDGGVPI